MTISSTSTTVAYVGENGRTEWPVPFPFLEPEDVRVIRTEVDGTDSSLVYGSEYTVTATDGGTGGSCQCSAPAGTGLVLYRDVAPLQEIDLRNTGILAPEVIENGLDRLTLITQQLREEVTRCVQVGRTSGLSPADLLAGVDEARSVCTVAQQSASADAATAVSAKNTAVSARNAAQAAEAAASGHYEDVLAAHDTAVAAVQAEEAAAVSAVKTEKNSAVAAVTSAKTSALTAVSTARSDALAAVAAEEAGAVTAVTAERGSAVSMVRNERDAAVDTVQAERDIAVQGITALPDYAFDKDAFLRDWTTKLITGAVDGTEGRWKLVNYGMLTISSASYTERNVGSVTLFIDNTTSGGGGYYGSSGEQLLPDMSGYIFGDSGSPYEVINASFNSEGVRCYYVRTHPKHGDVRSDVTIGNTYPVLVFQESTDPVDQQTGELDYVDVFVGSNCRVGTDIYNHQVSTTQSGWNSAKVDVNPDNTVDTSNNNDIVLPYVVKATDSKFPVSAIIGKQLVIEGIVHADSLAPLLFVRVNNNSGNAIEVNAAAGEYFRISVDISASISGDLLIEFIFESAGLAMKKLQNVHMLLEDNTALFSLLGGIGSYATLNAGYFDGTVWRSQLLGDLYAWVSQPSVFEIKMSRPVLDNSAEPIAKILNASGAWVVMNSMKNSASWSEDQNIPVFTSRTVGKFFDSGNTAWVNLGACYASLGYSSVADLFANSAITVEYKTKPRVLRPAKYEWKPFAAIGERVWFLDNGHKNGGVFALHDMIGHVPTVSASGVLNYSSVENGADVYSAFYGAMPLGTISYTGAPRYPSESRSAVVHCALVEDSTYKIYVMFKELVLDGTYGDDKKIYWNDNSFVGVVTRTDDNGNTVLIGCMLFDTGIAV